MKVQASSSWEAAPDEDIMGPIGFIETVCSSNGTFETIVRRYRTGPIVIRFAGQFPANPNAASIVTPSTVIPKMGRASTKRPPSAAADANHENPNDAPLPKMDDP
jgi:hypothetical protein